MNSLNSAVDTNLTGGRDADMYSPQEQHSVSPSARMLLFISHTASEGFFCTGDSITSFPMAALDCNDGRIHSIQDHFHCLQQKLNRPQAPSTPLRRSRRSGHAASGSRALKWVSKTTCPGYLQRRPAGGVCQDCPRHRTSGCGLDTWTGWASVLWVPGRVASSAPGGSGSFLAIGVADKRVTGHRLDVIRFADYGQSI